MVRWLSTLTIYAGCLVLLAGTATAQPVTGHTNDDVFLTATTASVAEGSVGMYSSSIGQVPGSPLFTEDFVFQSGLRTPFVLTFEPGSLGGVVVFSLGKGDSVNMGTAAPFDALLVRTSAVPAGTRINVTDLVLGPPPSLGGGGNLIFETSAPGTLAKSRATGANGLDILKISGVDFAAGFTLKGNVTATFNEQVPPTGDELLLQVYLADTPDIDDADGDGVADDVDNCPTNANNGQADDDGDGFGNACDNCDATPNSPNLGTCGAGKLGYSCTANAECDTEIGAGDGSCVLSQADGDEDGAGDVCDNCNVGCTPLHPSSAPTCSNDQNADQDNDGVGDLCDNCIDTPNGPILGTCLTGFAGLECASNAECDTSAGAGDGFCSQNQENSDGDGDGDACLDSTIGFSLDDSVAGATAPGEAAYAVDEIPTPAAAGDEVVFATNLSCGSQNIAEANIGFTLPEGDSVFEGFAGCDTPTNNGSCDTASSTCDAGKFGETCTTDADCNNEFICTGAHGVALGSTVSESSTVIGPYIQDPDPTDDDEVPARLVILKLKGDLPRGFAKDLLCEAEDIGNPGAISEVELGPITVSNLPDGGTILISDDGFAALGLTLLEDPGSMSVPATAIKTKVSPSGDVPFVEMFVNPHSAEAGVPDGKRFTVTMKVPGGELINGMAFGLRGPPGILPSEMSFGGCVPGGSANGIAVNTCSANGDLSAGVAPSTTSDPPGTFTVDPNAEPALFAANTLMIAVRGDILEGLDPSLNVGDEIFEIGTVTFNIPFDPPQSAPTIDFLYATRMPGFEDGAIQLADGEGGTIAPNQVDRVVGGNADGDEDGDGKGNDIDNCPFVENTLQENNGGVRESGNAVDFIGDVCQCGDSSGDGAVLDGFDDGEPAPNDIKDCQELLAGMTSGDTDLDEERRARCSVTGVETPSIIDLVVLELDLEQENSAGTRIEQICRPARPVIEGSD